MSEMHWNVTACHIYVHTIDKLTMHERFSNFRPVVLNLVQFMYIFGDLRFTINLFLMFFFGIRKGTKESIVPWGFFNIAFIQQSLNLMISRSLTVDSQVLEPYISEFT